MAVPIFTKVGYNSAFQGIMNIPLFEAPYIIPALGGWLFTPSSSHPFISAQRIAPNGASILAQHGYILNCTTFATITTPAGASPGGLFFDGNQRDFWPQFYNVRMFSYFDAARSQDYIEGRDCPGLPALNSTSEVPAGEEIYGKNLRAIISENTLQKGFSPAFEMVINNILYYGITSQDISFMTRFYGKPVYGGPRILRQQIFQDPDLNAGLNPWSNYALVDPVNPRNNYNYMLCWGNAFGNTLPVIKAYSGDAFTVTHNPTPFMRQIFFGTTELNNLFTFGVGVGLDQRYSMRTRFGWLLYSPNTCTLIPGMLGTAILLSYDGTKFWLANFMAMTRKASVALANPANTWRIAFDPNGHAYFSSGNPNVDPGLRTIFTSCSLDLLFHWPNDKLPIIGMPCYGTCTPAPMMASPL